MALKEIVNEMISLVKEKREVEQKLEKAHDAVVAALVGGDDEKLTAAIKEFASLVGKDEEFAGELAKTLTGLAIEDEGIAKSVWLSALERKGVIDELTKRFADREEAIRSKVVQFVLKGIFGGVSTEEDEAVAKEQLAKALETAETMDDIIGACKTYIMVKANRLAQECRKVDPDIAKATQVEIKKAMRRCYEDELRREIEKRLAKGENGAVTKELFALWLKARNADDLTDKLYPLLAKTKDFELIHSAVRRAKGGA